MSLISAVGGSWLDILRLIAVPVLAWAALRDLRTRRVPNAIWGPLLVIGAIALLVEGSVAWATGGWVWQRFLIATAVSLGLVIPLAYGFWWIGGFGGADAKALMTLAVLFPTFPQYELGTVTLPVVESSIGSFVLTILTNAVLIGLLYPVGMTVMNLVRGDMSRVMVVGRQYNWTALEHTHGRVLETPDGYTRRGLDLDALRMYLRWRGIDLETLRTERKRLRDPATLPDEPHPPTDGAVTDGGRQDDPWGAAAFLETIEGSAYGTDPETLREGLDVITTHSRVWVSPGIPFFVPILGGLLVGLIYGDLLYGTMVWVGLVP